MKAASISEVRKSAEDSFASGLFCAENALGLKIPASVLARADQVIG